MTAPDAAVPELDGAPLFLLDDLPDEDEVLVGGAEGRHAVDVLRLAPGETVRVSDGAGTVVEGAVLSAGPDGLRVDVRARYEVPRPDPEFVLVQALPKGDRGPLAVELATELGVDRIVPWTASRCVTRWREDRAEKGLARWRAGRAGRRQAVAPSAPARGHGADVHARGVRADRRRRSRGRAARAGPPSAGRAAGPARAGPSSWSSAPRAG